MPPAYRIETPRLILRCWDPRDAPLLRESIAASIDHLRANLMWAQTEPQTLEETVQRLRQSRAKFDLDQEFLFGVFDRDERSVLGGCGLHPRVFEGGLEIGYWIDTRHLRRGLATELTAALTRVAFEVAAMRRVEIHIDTRNVASQGVPRKLGFTHEATLPARVNHPLGLGDRMIFTLHAASYRASSAAALPVTAHGAGAERLL